MTGASSNTAVLSLIALLLAGACGGSEDAGTSSGEQTTGAVEPVNDAEPTDPTVSAPPADAPPAADPAVVAGLEAVATNRAATCLVVTGPGLDVDVRGTTALIPASGIKVLTSRAAVDLLGEDAAADGSTVGDLAARALADSDGDAADALATAVGGTAAIGEHIRSLGVPADNLVVDDAAGFSRDNRLSCQTLHAVLATDDPDGPIGSRLAVAGESGTLADRFTDSPLAGVLKAKTGSIRGVVAFAGYLPTDSGLVTFALIGNGLASEQAGRDLQAALVGALELLAG